MSVNMAMGKPSYLIVRDPDSGPLGRGGVRRSTRWIIGRGLLGNAVAGGARTRRSRSTFPGTTRSSRADARRRPAPLSCRQTAPSRSTGAPARPSPRRRGGTGPGGGGLQAFVSALGAASAEDRARVTFFLASSVGGAYASSAAAFTESTPAIAGSDYGRAKLQMETFAGRNGGRGWRTFIGRITNLYGPVRTWARVKADLRGGQQLHHWQAGVHLCVPRHAPRLHLRGRLRGVVDAGVRAPPGGARDGRDQDHRCHDGDLDRRHPREQNRLRRRRSPVVIGGGDPRGQSLDLRVRSEVWTDLDGLVRTTFGAGLDAVFRAQLATHAERDRARAQVTGLPFGRPASTSSDMTTIGGTAPKRPSARSANRSRPGTRPHLPGRPAVPTSPLTNTLGERGVDARRVRAHAGSAHGRSGTKPVAAASITALRRPPPTNQVTWPHLTHWPRAGPSLPAAPSASEIAV